MPKMKNNEEGEQDAGVVVARLRKNQREEIVISVRNYEKNDYVDIRTYFGLRGEEMRPTAKGVTVPIALYPEFRRLMEQLEDVMEDKGWA